MRQVVRAFIHVRSIHSSRTNATPLFRIYRDHQLISPVKALGEGDKISVIAYGLRYFYGLTLSYRHPFAQRAMQRTRHREDVMKIRQFATR